MAIQGLVTTREVVRHTVTIISSFGLGAYLRCCQAIVSGRRTTFLQCAVRFSR